MGSYCHTCAVSHLPIERGDSVVGLVVAQEVGTDNQDPVGYTSSGALWKAVSLPFTGVYDNYGFLGDIAPGRAAQTLEAVSGMTFEALCDAVRNREEVLMQAGGPGRGGRLAVMFVHAGVWERLTTAVRPLVGPDRTLSDELRRVDEIIDLITTADETARRMMSRPSGFAELDTLWSRVTGRSWVEAPVICNLLINRKSDALHHGLSAAVGSMALNACLEGEIDKARGLLQDALPIAFFDRNMSHLRRLWTPQCGLGSTTTALDLHADLADYVATRCRMRIAQEDAEDCEDEDGLEDAPAGLGFS